MVHYVAGTVRSAHLRHKHLPSNQMDQRYPAERRHGRREDHRRRAHVFEELENPSTRLSPLPDISGLGHTQTSHETRAPAPDNSLIREHSGPTSPHRVRGSFLSVPNKLFSNKPRSPNARPLRAWSNLVLVDASASRNGHDRKAKEWSTPKHIIRMNTAAIRFDERQSVGQSQLTLK